MRRHNAVRDALAAWLREMKLPALCEQAVPRWHREADQAILDIVYRDARVGEVCVDVSVVDSAHPTAPRTAPMALQRREANKHRRYPGPGLVPFVVDARGRWGREACAWVQSVTASLPDDARQAAVRQCRIRIGRVLQLAIADQLLEAVRPRQANAGVVPAANATPAVPAAQTAPPAQAHAAAHSQGEA